MSPGLRDLVIIAGGQTGADRAALDFAIAHGVRHGGWCPRGRMAEDGPLDRRYLLRETPSSNYAERTEWNARQADATAVFSLTREVTGGTRLTLDIAQRLGKPLLHLARDGEPAPPDRIAACAAALRGFLDVYQVKTLNVAGPRASQAPGVGEFVTSVLTAALAAEE